MPQHARNVFSFFICHYCESDLFEEHIAVHMGVGTLRVIHPVLLHEAGHFLAEVVNETEVAATKEAHVVRGYAFFTQALLNVIG